MKQVVTLAIVATAVTLSVGFAHGAESETAAASKPGAMSDIERGRYMVMTGHCNNCHTSGYAGKQGDVPEKEWLLGNPIGFKLPSGTTYASNLRLTIQAFGEDQWVQYAKGAKPRAPMPWWSFQATAEQDLRAMYRYIRSLGPAGQPMPDFVPADKEPPRPFEVRQIVR